MAPAPSSSTQQRLPAERPPGSGLQRQHGFLAAPSAAHASVGRPRPRSAASDDAAGARVPAPVALRRPASAAAAALVPGGWDTVTVRPAKLREAAPPPTMRGADGSGGRRCRSAAAAVAFADLRHHLRLRSAAEARKPSFDFRRQQLVEFDPPLMGTEQSMPPRALTGSALCAERHAQQQQRKWQQRRRQQRGLNFNAMPLDCRLQVFSYLTQQQKGRCLAVCRSWNADLRSAQLWVRIDFSEFNLCAGGHEALADTHRMCGAGGGGGGGGVGAGQEAGADAAPSLTGHCGWPCYYRYEQRIDGYVSFLIALRPWPRVLALSFDIGADRWRSIVERFLLGVDLSQLRHARVNWKETPTKPFWLDKAAAALSLERHFALSRARQAVFAQLFALFVERAPALRTLAMPFDWSPTSVELLLRLRWLQCLTLDKYFVLQALPPQLLARAVGGLPALERLSLEIWTPPPLSTRQSHTNATVSGSGAAAAATAAPVAALHTIASGSLRHLDISACRGFYLTSVLLPRLQSLRVRRHPWNGPLTTRDKFEVPCLCDVLAVGAPQLQRINDLALENGWHERPTTACSGGSGHQVAAPLWELLRQVCSCHEHRRTAIL